MKNATYIVGVFDRSTSMYSVKTDIEGGFNLFVDDQRKNNADECNLTLYWFDTFVEVAYTRMPITVVPKMILSPRGMTALYDGIGRAIDETGAYLASLPESERPDNVVFVIGTDGAENSSREYNLKQIKDKITHQQNIYSWKFVFLGTNIDAFEVGGSLGVSAASTMSYANNSSGINAMFMSVSDKMNMTRSFKGTDFTFDTADYSAQEAAGAR